MFISNAYASSALGSTDLMSFLPIVIIFILFFFIIIRPQMKQAKETRNMIAALKKGDEVATSGGVIGKVTKVGDSFVSIEIATDTIINVQKAAVLKLLPPGTIKSI